MIAPDMMTELTAVLSLLGGKDLLLQVLKKPLTQNRACGTKSFLLPALQINCNVTVSFTENCTIKATYEQYLYIGGIFEVRPKGGNVSDNKIDEYLTENGILGEKNGFYYLLLKDEVCVHHDAWKTNLEITDYKYEVNGYNSIHNKSA